MAEATDYTQIGYDQYFQRQPAGGKEPDDPYFLQSLYASQDVQSIDTNMVSQISGNQIGGGIMSSSDGNLNLNLDAGTLNYNDGVTSLLNIDPVNGLQIRDSAGNLLVDTNKASTTPPATL